MKKIAFFDFDGTITERDSVLEFIKYRKGLARYFAGLLWHLPIIVGMQIRLIRHQWVKEKLLQWFFGKESQAHFKEQAERFAMEHLPAMIRPKSMGEIWELKEHGFEIVVVTAAPIDWVKPFCDLHQIQVIGSGMAVKEGFITGKLDAKNCRGMEKVRRIQQQYELQNYQQVYCYGDTTADIPMLLLATHSFYKPFR